MSRLESPVMWQSN